MLLVFVNNKLGTVDTIVPILLEMKEKYGVKSYVIVTERLSNYGIRKNVVIHDAVTKSGSIVYLGYGFNNRILRLFFTFIQIQKLILFSLLGAKIIHFGALNSGPLSVLFRAFSKNIFFSQSLAFKFTGDQYRKPYIKKIPLMPLGNSIIATNNLMPELELKEINKNNIYLFGPTRMRRVWLEHSYYNAEFYFKKYHPTVNYKEGYIVVVLYTFGKVVWFEDLDTAEILLKETLNAIHAVHPGKTILIKPHVVTPMKTLSNIINNSSCKSIEITNLHPSVLSRFSDLFICNCYSNTLADASSLGVPTIEYTKYKKELLLRTNNKSINHEFVDYFINQDKKHLEMVLSKVLSIKAKKCFDINKSVLDEDESKLLLNLQ